MRKLIMLAVAAVAALAFAAPASADTGVSVETEATSQPCTLATCTAHVVNSGDIELEGHVFGFHTHWADCTTQYTLSINASGEGTMNNFSFGGGLDCGDIALCDTPWTFHGEELGGGLTELEANVCFDLIVSCDGVLDLTLTDHGNHVYTASAIDQPIPSPSFGVDCEVTGNWELEEAASFEIIHSDD